MRTDSRWTYKRSCRASFWTIAALAGLHWSSPVCTYAQDVSTSATPKLSQSQTTDSPSLAKRFDAATQDSEGRIRGIRVVKEDAASSVTLPSSETSVVHRLSNKGNFATPIRALQPLGDEAPESIGDGRDALPLDDLSNAAVLPDDEMMRLSGYEGDHQAYVPAPLTGAPARPLQLEELLAANRERQPVYYRDSVMDKGVSKLATPLETSLPSEDFRIETANFIDYDSERNLLYGADGVVVRYGPYELQADRMILDTRTRDLQAAGNVVLTNDTTYVSCESLRFNANTNQGVAFGVRGRVGTLYFVGKKDNNRTFTFRQLSREESLMQDAAMTTCDFPKPHLRVQAKEFTVLDQQRIIANNAVLYAGDCPVMWLPYFTWSLESDNPWGATIGSDTQNGFFFRGWYHYYDEYETPDPLDDSKTIKVSDAHARLFTDWFSSRGNGLGLDYDYVFYDGKSRGRMNLYEMNDTKRMINGQSDSDRYLYSGWNRTRLGDSNFDLVSSLFYPSDPDIFYDVLDRFRSTNDPTRNRIMERGGSIGVENTKDDLFVGFNYSFRDRIGRNRATDYANPMSDDGDFDRRYNSESYFYSAGGTITEPFPGTYYDPTSSPAELDKGIDRNRYGRVSEKFQGTVSTNQIQLAGLPLYYSSTLDVFRNLDKGLNTVNTVDDSYVNGFNFYNSLTSQLKFGERTTLVSRYGVGVGVAEREDKSFNLVPEGAVFAPYYITDAQWINGVLDGVRWVDRDTMLVGTKEMSLKNVKSDYGYADMQHRLTTRLTDGITGYADVLYRKASDDSLGQFYREIGAVKSRDDLYDFQTDKTWAETGLIFRSSIPRLNAQLSTGGTWDGESEHTPNQLLNKTGIRMNWVNRLDTISLSGGSFLNETQVRDSSDPDQFHQNTLEYALSGRVNNRRKNMYARTSAVIIQNRKTDPIAGGSISSVANTNDLDTRDESVLSFGIGREVGRKYLLEYTNNYRTSDVGDTEQFFTVSRDFHDVIASIGFGLMNNGELSTSNENAQQDSWEVRFNMKFKRAASDQMLPFLRSTSEYTQTGLGAFDAGS